MRADISKELDDIFGDVPLEISQEFELPSKGVFYNSKISKVKLRPLVFEDEKLILQARRSRTDVMDALLTSCIQGVPQDFVSSLVIIDKMFLILKLREISFGKNLLSKIHCPSCQGLFDVTIDIGEIPVTPFEGDESYLRFTLPVLKKEVVIKLLRSRDQKLVESAESIHNELYKYIVSLAGKTETLVISEALKKLSAVDIQVLISKIGLQGYGIDPRFEYACEGEGGCGYRGLLAIPIDEDFFSVKSSDYGQT